MTLKQFAGVDAYLRDKKTKREISHEEYLHRIVTKLKVELVKKCIPFSTRELKDAYMHDSNFNTTPRHHWEQTTEISKLFMENGITIFCTSEKVAVLKYAAKLICEGR